MRVQAKEGYPLTGSPMCLRRLILGVLRRLSMGSAVRRPGCYATNADAWLSRTAGPMGVAMVVTAKG